MKETKYDQWLHELQNEVGLLDEDDSRPLERIRHSLPLISNFIAGIKKEVIAEGFADKESEIYFFKRIKPQMLALQLYEVLNYHLATQRPEGTAEMVKMFFETELLQTFREFRINAFAYQYYRTNATELDHQYFLREAKSADIPVLELIDPAPGFSTAMDYTFARFIAYERLRDYLLEQLTNAQVQFKLENTVKKNEPQLVWTGDTINLAELAYGICLTGQINHGNAGVTEIIRWLEFHFQIKVGKVHRRWQSISLRKRVSPVKFLDQMRKAIIQRLDDENK